MSGTDNFPVQCRLFPVCCAAVVDPQTIDHLISTTRDTAEEKFLVILDNVTEVINDETKVGEWTQSTSAESPFIGKSPVDCYLLLRRLISETDSDINHEHFAIIDERTLKDGSKLLVDGPWGKGEENGVARTVRVVPELAQDCLLLYNIGEPEIDEDQAVAQEAEAGVLRLQALMDRAPA